MSEEAEDLERYFRSVEEMVDHTLRIGRVLRAAYPSASDLHFAMTGRRLPSDDPLEDEFREMEAATTEDD